MKAGLDTCLHLAGASLGCFLKLQAPPPHDPPTTTAFPWLLGHMMLLPAPGPLRSLLLLFRTLFPTLFPWLSPHPSGLSQMSPPRRDFSSLPRYIPPLISMFTLYFFSSWCWCQFLIMRLCFLPHNCSLPIDWVFLQEGGGSLLFVTSTVPGTE